MNHRPLVWREFSHRVGGRFLYGNGGRPVVQWSRGGWLLTLDLVEPDAHEPRLRFRAPYPTEAGFPFTISPKEGWLNALRDLFDRDEGPALLPEDRFEVQCERPDLLASLLEQRDLGRRLRESPPHLLASRGDELWGRSEYPVSLDVLLMEVRTREDVDQLEIFAALFTDVAGALEDLSLGSDADQEERLLRQLHGPGGKVSDGGIEVWDGDLLRHQAAQKLAARACRQALPGILRLLEEESAGTRLAATKALRKLRDPSAVPALIPLLADERIVGSAQVREEAAVTLRKLGAGNWVDWFRRVTAGTMPARRLDGPYREAAIRALLRLRTDSDAEQAVRVCRALGELGAPETFAAVRAAIARHGREKVGPALEPLLKELESVAALPRPAAPPAPELDALPVTSAAPQSSDETVLPRPSDQPEER